MKIQSLAVILAIILLPIIIILSYYIHKEIDTITLQASYDTKLIDSTHDAMSALEINTANEDLSSVADSLRSIIQASTNVFYNTLATNLGISNAGDEAVDTYIPAILYTLYDGYYIYAPTRVPTPLTCNDQVVYIGDKGVEREGTITYTQGGKTLETGRYIFNEAEWKSEKIDLSLPPQIANEYGQMLYLNEDGSYSAKLHSTATESSKNTKYKQEPILKSFMPYSARYKGSNTYGNYDLMINYTLDNYMSIEGTIGEVYYSKTGYLISNGTVKGGKGTGTETLLSKMKIDEDGNYVSAGEEINDILTYNEITAENKILSGEYVIDITLDPIVESPKRLTEFAGQSAVKIHYEPMRNEDTGEIISYVKAKELIKKYNEAKDKEPDKADMYVKRIQDLEYGTEQLSAICYYIKAEIFSEWVYKNLGGSSDGASNAIRAKNISDEIANLNQSLFETDSEMELFHRFADDETIIFDSNANPELEDSPFYNHKIEVIRNNVQYNLNLAMSAYNTMVQMQNIQMPAISDSEWERILTRISVTSFMQGLQCGMKIYSNYAIASSTNNEFMTSPTQHYYVLKDQFNTADVTNEYHALECDLLEDDESGNQQYISFTTKDMKFDKIYDRETKRYAYDHRNLGCYKCAIPSNFYKKVMNKDKSNTVDGHKDEVDILALGKTNKKAKQRAYFTAVGATRQDTYKTNALTDSNGYEIIYNGQRELNFGTNESTFKIFSGSSVRPIDEVREVEITLANLVSGSDSEATVHFKLQINTLETIDYTAVFNLKQATPQTMTIPVHINNNGKINGLTLNKSGHDETVKCDLKNIKVIYE